MEWCIKNFSNCKLDIRWVIKSFSCSHMKVTIPQFRSSLSQSFSQSLSHSPSQWYCYTVIAILMWKVMAASHQLTSDNGNAHMSLRRFQNDAYSVITVCMFQCVCLWLLIYNNANIYCWVNVPCMLIDTLVSQKYISTYPKFDYCGIVLTMDMLWKYFRDNAVHQVQCHIQYGLEMFPWTPWYHLSDSKLAEWT